MPKVFISHSSRDRPFIAGTLLPVLRENGLQTWYSSEDIPSASDWEKTIRSGLQECEWFLVVLSQHAIASEWVQAEVHWALDHRKNRFVSLIISDCTPSDLHLKLIRYQHIDCRRDLAAAIKRLLVVLPVSAAAAKPARPDSADSKGRIADKGKPGSDTASAVALPDDTGLKTPPINVADASGRPAKGNPPRNKSRILRYTGIVATPLLLLAGLLVGFARFGDPQVMPIAVLKLAESVRNPRTFRVEVTPGWARLCRAWDSWLGDLQNNAPRLLRTDQLWSGPKDTLRVALADFTAKAGGLLPGSIVPEAAGEKRFGVLADQPPFPVRQQLLIARVADEVDQVYGQVDYLALQLEEWPRWGEMRAILQYFRAHGFARVADALKPRLPPAFDSAGYRRDPVRTLKIFNDVSLDDTGTLLLVSRWSEIMRLKAEMEGSGDRIQTAMPELILALLIDHASISDFADSLASPLEELRRHRQQFLDPLVVQELFLKGSPLQRETAKVTLADIPRWEKELVKFSKKPAAKAPR